jgi:hypothetical protein
MQVLALFNKAVRKLCNALRAVQEKGIEAEINTTTGTILNLHFTILYYTILYCTAMTCVRYALCIMFTLVLLQSYCLLRV